MAVRGGRHASGPVAPDGGWGWMVVLASFVLRALTMGITYTFGVIFVDLLDYFKASQSATAWIGSIQPALLYFTGILCGPLIRRFGWRKLTIFGTVLSSIGFGTSALAPNVYMLYFTYGVLTGIGNGLVYVTSMVAVQHYFDTRRSLATGIGAAGSGVGTLTFGLLTRSLLDNLGWRWTLVVEAGIMLTGVIFGAMLRPLPVDNQLESTEESNMLVENLNGGVVEKQENGLYERKYRDCCGNSQCASAFSEVFDLSLFKNPIFSIFCFSFFMFCFGYHAPYTYTPERARQLGVDPQSASFLVSIMGIANVGSRLTFGWIGDQSPTIRFYLAGVTLILGGIISILIFLFTSYSLMIVYSVLFGVFTGGWSSLFSVILVDMLGIDLIERSLGQCLAAGSLAFLLASPISGLIIEGTGGNFDTPFLVMGGMETLGGIAFFAIKCFQRRSRDYQNIPGLGHEIRRRRRSYISESF